MKTPKAIVKCKLHGTFNYKNKTYEVLMPLPQTKRERLAGCPMCRRGIPAKDR